MSTVTFADGLTVPTRIALGLNIEEDFSLQYGVGTWCRLSHPPTGVATVTRIVSNDFAGKTLSQLTKLWLDRRLKAVARIHKKITLIARQN